MILMSRAGKLRVWATAEGPGKKHEPGALKLTINGRRDVGAGRAEGSAGGSDRRSAGEHLSLSLSRFPTSL